MSLEMNATDAELLRHYCRERSEEAFAELVRRNLDLVYSTALRQVRSPQLAEEVVQSVFIDLNRSAQCLAAGTILTAWLYQVARRTAVDVVRREARRQMREQIAIEMTVMNASDDDWKQIEPLLDDAMAALDETDRAAVLLRYFENKSLREVGEALGTSDDAAQKRVSRAVERLREFFAKQGVTVGASGLAVAISANAVQAAPAALSYAAVAVAVFHGAAAAGAVPSLLTSALSQLSWTSTKTALAVAAIILLVVVAGIRRAHIAGFPDIQGAWEGIIHLDDAGVAPGEAASTRVVWKFVKTNGDYTATTDWIEKGRIDVPMGRVTYNYPSLRVERNPREIWTLTVNADATEMLLDHSIHFIQPDPVVLKRTTTPSQVPPRLAEIEFAPRPGSALQGYWKGILGTETDALPVNLKIAEQADGSFRAEGDNPMQGANGQPVTVTYSHPWVELALATGAGIFRGTIDNAHTEMVGVGIQDGQSIPMSFKRADYRLERAWETGRDYSFTSNNDLPGHWKGEWDVTIGTVKVTIRQALDIARRTDGTYSVTLANYDQFGNDDPIPTSDFQYEPPVMQMKWKWAGWAFEGKMEEDRIVGSWIQGGGSFPLVFERVK